MKTYSVPKKHQHHHIPAMHQDLRAELMQWIGLGPGFYTVNDIRELGRAIDLGHYHRQADMK